MQYATEDEDMLNRIIIGDESWFHHSNLNQNIRHCNGSILLHLLPAKKFKVTSSVGKVMVTLFRDCKGMIIAEFYKRGENVNSQSYSDVLLSFGLPFGENVQTY